MCCGVCKSMLCSVQYLLEGIRCSVRICELCRVKSMYRQMA